MIIIKDIRESLLEQEIPGTLKALRAIAQQLESMGFDIEIRDTDHTFDSLRIYPVSRKEFNEVTYKEAESILNKTINNSCSQCGTNKDIKPYPYNDRNDWSVSHILCHECHQETLPFIPPLFPGILKDSTEKDVQDGDIIMGITKDGRIFWGLIVAKQTTLKECYAKPSWSKDDFILLHNPHSFPSHLSHADKFIIIANCGTNHNPFDNYDPHYQKYDKWCRKINKSKKWFWKKKKFDFDKYEEFLKGLLKK